MPTPRGRGRCSCGRRAAADRCGLPCSSAPPARARAPTYRRPWQLARVMATLTASNIADKTCVDRSTGCNVKVCELAQMREDQRAVFPVDRRRRILQQVAEQQSIRIGELARELGV